MKKKTYDFVHLMIKEYDNILSKNKKKFYIKYVEALESDRQFQIRELQKRDLKKELDFVIVKSKHVVKEFETISWNKGKTFAIYDLQFTINPVLTFVFFVFGSSVYGLWADKTQTYTLKNLFLQW